MTASGFLFSFTTTVFPHSVVIHLQCLSVCAVGLALYVLTISKAVSCYCGSCLYSKRIRYMWQVAFFFSIKCDNGVSITLSKMDLSFVLTYVVSLKHFFSPLVFFFYSHSISHLLLIPLFPPEPTRPSVAQDYVGIQFQFQRVVRILLHPAALSSLG